MAETTTATSWPCWRVSSTRLATRFIFSGVPTELPPNFCTTIDITSSVPNQYAARQSRLA